MRHCHRLLCFAEKLLLSLPGIVPFATEGWGRAKVMSHAASGTSSDGEVERKGTTNSQRQCCAATLAPRAARATFRVQIECDFIHWQTRKSRRISVNFASYFFEVIGTRKSEYDSLSAGRRKETA